MMRRLAALVLAGSLAALASLAPPPLAPAVPTCAAAGPHHVALVVEHGNGSAVKRCVAFTTASISGQQLLANSGVSWSGETFGGFGEAVCALDGEPAQYAACPGKDAYWAVFVARSGAAWQLANVGISSLALHDGDAEGFRYVPASGTPAAPPSPAGVCAAAQNPAPTPRATAPAPARASGTAAAATSTAASAASGPEVPPSPGSSASPLEVAAVAGSSESSNPSAPAQPSVPPSSPSGPDLGLLAAALAGGGLAGLAILRLLAGRRPGP
jgi:hypothetical protein